MWAKSNSQAHIELHGQFANACKREKNFRTLELNDPTGKHSFLKLVSYSSVMFSTRWRIMGETFIRSRSEKALVLFLRYMVGHGKRQF